jgi:hypothetical protein
MAQVQSVQHTRLHCFQLLGVATCQADVGWGRCQLPGKLVLIKHSSPNAKM